MFCKRFTVILTPSKIPTVLLADLTYLLFELPRGYFVWNQFWRHANEPKALFSQVFTQQKLEYVPNNPVEVGALWVKSPELQTQDSIRYETVAKLG